MNVQSGGSVTLSMRLEYEGKLKLIESNVRFPITLRLLVGSVLKVVPKNVSCLNCRYSQFEMVKA